MELLEFDSIKPKSIRAMKFEETKMEGQKKRKLTKTSLEEIDILG